MHLHQRRSFYFEALAFVVTILLPQEIVPKQIPEKPEKNCPYDPIVVAKYDLADAQLQTNKGKYLLRSFGYIEGSGEGFKVTTV